MNMRKICFLVGICLILGCFSPVQAEEISISAESAIVMDAGTGTVLYEKNADKRSLIASTTKIMTGYLACLQENPDRLVTIPAEAVGIEGSSIYLQAGERLSLRCLLYGTLLQSGNDAATALAIGCAGSEAAFVAQMNRTAKILGLDDTHYANPHGLDSEDNYSTARDLAKLSCAAMKNRLFAEVVSTKTASFGNRCFVNHNKLLWRLEGAAGIKTGYTKAAGRILVSARRIGDRLLVVVTIHAPDDWNDHERLYEAFASAEPTASMGEMLCPNDCKKSLRPAGSAPGERLRN